MLAVLVLLGVTGRPATAQQTPFPCRSFDDVTEPVTMRVAERLDIGLASNPSTGYGWQLKATDVPGAFSGVGPSRVLTPPSQPGGPPLVGAGGQECFGLTANMPGTYTIFFRYARPFDPPTTPPARTKELTVIVVPAGAPVQLPRAAVVEESPG